MFVKLIGWVVWKPIPAPLTYTQFHDSSSLLSANILPYISQNRINAEGRQMKDEQRLGSSLQKTAG